MRQSAAKPEMGRFNDYPKGVGSSEPKRAASYGDDDIVWSVRQLAAAEWRFETSDLKRTQTKGGKELKRNIEKTILGTQGKALAGTTTARLSGGLLTYIHRTTFVAHNMHATNTITWNGNGATLVGTVTLTGGSAGILKALLDTVIGVLWDHGSDANVIICNKGQKQGITNMSGIATLYREVPMGNQGAIVGGADLYVSNFGEFVVVPDRFTDASNHTIYLTDYEYLALAELDPIDVIPVAKTGDADKAMIVCEACLEVRSTDAHGAVFAEYSA
jgi:hypothetical protein